LNNRDVIDVDEECLAALRSHSWPGNVRQLRNVIERALIVCRARVIGKHDLPEEFQSVAQVGSGDVKMRIGVTLEEMEKELIFRTIEFTSGNKTRAAQVLGISAKTLYNKLERYSSQGR